MKKYYAQRKISKEREDYHLSARWKEWTVLFLKKKTTRTRKPLMAPEVQVRKQVNNFYLIFQVDMNMAVNWK